MCSTKTWHAKSFIKILFALVKINVHYANDKGMVHLIDICMLYTLMSYNGHVHVHYSYLNDEHVRILFIYTRNHFFSHPISHDT